MKKLRAIRDERYLMNFEKKRAKKGYKKNSKIYIFCYDTLFNKIKGLHSGKNEKINL